MNLLIILLAIAVGLIKFCQGFGIDIKRLITHANYGLIIRGVLTAVILVPILFLILILIFRPTTAITLAIILMGVAPAADLSTRQVKKLGGDVQLAESILLIASLISIVTVPLFLKFFELILGLHLEVPFTSVVKQVAMVQFIPIVLGVTLRNFFPKIDKLANYIISGATLLLIICFVLIIIQKYSVFAEFKINAYLALIVATVSAFILGIVFAGKNAKNQITLAIETSLRNPGLAFLIASENFAQEKAGHAMIPYVIITVFTVILCTLLLKMIQKHYIWR